MSDLLGKRKFKFPVDDRNGASRAMFHQVRSLSESSGLKSKRYRCKLVARCYELFVAEHVFDPTRARGRVVQAPAEKTQQQKKPGSSARQFTAVRA